MIFFKPIRTREKHATGKPRKSSVEKSMEIGGKFLVEAYWAKYFFYFKTILSTTFFAFKSIRLACLFLNAFYEWPLASLCKYLNIYTKNLYLMQLDTYINVCRRTKIWGSMWTAWKFIILTLKIYMKKSMWRPSVAPANKNKKKCEVVWV